MNKIMRYVLLTFSLTPPGVFDLAGPYGHPAGHIQISLWWKFPYISPASSGETELPVAEKMGPSERKPQSQKDADVDKSPNKGFVPPDRNEAQVRTAGRTIDLQIRSCTLNPRNVLKLLPADIIVKAG